LKLHGCRKFALCCWVWAIIKTTWWSNHDYNKTTNYYKKFDWLPPYKTIENVIIEAVRNTVGFGY
jgi:hypothetical protein